MSAHQLRVVYNFNKTAANTLFSCQRLTETIKANGKRRLSISLIHWAKYVCSLEQNMYFLYHDILCLFFIQSVVCWNVIHSFALIIVLFIFLFLKDVYFKVWEREIQKMRETETDTLDLLASSSNGCKVRAGPFRNQEFGTCSESCM